MGKFWGMIGASLGTTVTGTALVATPSPQVHSKFRYNIRRCTELWKRVRKPKSNFQLTFSSRIVLYNKVNHFLNNWDGRTKRGCQLSVRASYSCWFRRASCGNRLLHGYQASTDQAEHPSGLPKHWTSGEFARLYMHAREPTNSPHFSLQDGVRVSQYAKDGKLIEYIDEDSRTVYELFQRGLRLSSEFRMDEVVCNARCSVSAARTRMCVRSRVVSDAQTKEFYCFWIRVCDNERCCIAKYMHSLFLYLSLSPSCR